MSSQQLGLFWEPEVKKAKGGPIRSMPKIPKTGWKAPNPADWPNFKHAKKIAIDVETFDPNLKTHGPGWARHDGHLVGISAAVSRRESVYLPMRHTIKPKQNCDPEKVLLWAKDNLRTPALKIGANIQYDIGWLREEGVHVSGPYLDVQHAETLIDENLYTYNLESLAQRYLQQGKVSKKLYKWLARYYGGKINADQRKNIYRSPASLVGPYAEADAWQPYQIWLKQEGIIQQQGLEKVLDIEQRLIPMLLDMRFKGVRIDIPYVEQLRDEVKQQELKAFKKLDKTAGRHVEIYASKSIEKAFKLHGMKYPLTEKGNPSFPKMFLENHNSKLANLIVECRQLNKLRVTFLENALLGKNVNGIIHCQFNQLRARSGRFSSSDPNLQQVPVRTEMGKKVRQAFIPNNTDEDWYRLDSSQIEYRFLAHHAVGNSAEVIRSKYKKDKTTDFHNATTELVNTHTGILLERKPTKTINFGLCYGMGKAKLQESLGLTPKKGNILFDAYHRGVPFVKDTFDHFAKMAADTGIVTTYLGRRSRFEMYEEPWGDEFVHGYRAALAKWGPNCQRAFTHKGLNRVLQGGAADHLKTAMVQTYESGVFDILGGVPSLTVHDELDGSFNVNSKKQRKALMEVKNIMENCIKLTVPIFVDCEVGNNWSKVEKFNGSKPKG